MAYMVRRPSVFDHASDPFRFTTTQATPAFERLWDTGTVSILPARYSDLSGLFLDSGPYPVDAALIQVSAPGPEGRVSLGTSAGGNVDVAHNAPLVIAQVNEHVPYTFGASELEPGGDRPPGRVSRGVPIDTRRHPPEQRRQNTIHRVGETRNHGPSGRLHLARQLQRNLSSDRRWSCRAGGPLLGGRAHRAPGSCAIEARGS